MAEIYLVRHGQASFNSDDYDRLSDTGHRQSEYLGRYFADRNIEFSQIFTGSQQRHRQTADGICPARSVSRDVHPGLNEYDFAALYKAYMDQHPDEADAAKEGDRRVFYHRLKLALTLWSEGRLAGDLPESWAEFSTRVAAALDHIRDNADGICLVVSSGGAISRAIGHILDLAPQKIIDLNLQIKNSAFSHIYPGRDRLHLSSFNNVPHLGPDMITYS